MKTILWATLTANGNYAQSSAENPPKPEALADFAAQAKTAGNFIVGRKTFEGFAANGGGPFGDLDIVVTYTQSWHNLAPTQRADFRTQNGFRINWGPSNRDLTHGGLTAGPVRRFARNGYGLERRDYR